MAFDMGFNYRNTAPFVTDGTYAVPVIREAYPHTYTNVDGYSVNAGFSNITPVTGANAASGNDPRIAGYNYIDPGNEVTFQVDLSSGSAPGAGTYAVDFALGAADGGTFNQEWVLKDDTSALITVTGVTTSAGHYYDATVTNIAATTTWTGTSVNKVFASTTANFIGNVAAPAGYSGVAHFRLALQAGGAPSTSRLGHIAYGISNGVFLGR